MTQPDTNLMGQIHVAVIRLDAKVDSINSELRRLSDEHLRDHADHEGRIRVLESRQYVSAERFQQVADRPYVAPATVWKVVGAFFAISSIIVAIVNILLK